METKGYVGSQHKAVNNTDSGNDTDPVPEGPESTFINNAAMHPNNSDSSAKDVDTSFANSAVTIVRGMR